MTDERDKILSDIVSKINTKFGGNTATIGTKLVADCHRIPFKAFIANWATGGGIPVGRVVMLWGEESSGKTTEALRIGAVIQNICTLCYSPISMEIVNPDDERKGETVSDKDGKAVYKRIIKKPCTCGKNRLGKMAMVDAEGTYDESWARAVGLRTEEIVYARPASTEEAIDVTEALLRSGAIDLVVLDSIAAMAPTEEISKSAEDHVMGKNALLINRAWRVWNAAQSEVGNKDGIKPTLVVINQVRYKIGVMYGNPETRPGGNGQKFATSMEIRMKRAKYEEKKPYITVAGKVNKNKVSRAMLEYEYNVAIEDFDYGTKKIKKGEVFEYDTLLGMADKSGLIHKVGNKFLYKDEEFKRRGDLEEKILFTDEGYNQLKADLMELINAGKI